MKHTASFTAACTEDFLTEDFSKNLQNFLSIFLWFKSGYLSSLAQFFAKSLSEDFSKRNKNNVEITITMIERGNGGGNLALSIRKHSRTAEFEEK